MPNNLGLGTSIGLYDTRAPAWVSPSAALDLDFANERVYNTFSPSKTAPTDLLTYTAPSPKMVYGDDGVLGYAPHNLFTQSETFSHAAWTASSVTITPSIVAYDGNIRASRLTSTASGTSGLAQTMSVSSSLGAHTFAVVCKRESANIRLAITTDATSGTAAAAWFDLSTGTVGTVQAGVTAAIVDLSDDWYLCSITRTMTVAGSQIAYIRLATSDNVNNVDAAGRAVLISDCRMHRGASVLPYIATIAAAKYALPLDHDPETFDPLGILVEEQRTNLLLNSEDLSGAGWTTDSLSALVTVNATTAPNGTLTADKIVESGLGKPHNRYRSYTLTAAPYTSSWYLKAAERTKVKATLATASGALGAEVIVDLAAGTLSGLSNLGGHVGAVANIHALDNGWYRVSLTITGTAALYYHVLNILDASGNVSYNGDDVSGLYVWGAQLEAGAFPTSYIPTVASQVTRAADQVSILTSEFAYSALAGTISVEGDRLSAGTIGRWWSFSPISTGAFLEAITNVDGTARAAWWASGHNTANSDATAAMRKTAYAFEDAGNISRMSLKGGTVAASTGNDWTGGATSLFIGGRSGAANLCNGRIKKLTYFPTRKTDAELQALST